MQPSNQKLAGLRRKLHFEITQHHAPGLPFSGIDAALGGGLVTIQPIGKHQTVKEAANERRQQRWATAATPPPPRVYYQSAGGAGGLQAPPTAPSCCTSGPGLSPVATPSTMLRSTLLRFPGHA